jgi:glycosidase
MYGILPALKEPFGWTDGVNKLYTTLAQDFVYKDPMKHVNFLDNHDKTRFYSEIGEDFQKWKIGVGWLLTTRGIPQFYYGNEILMKGVSNPDGWVRLGFPGGWPGDKQNKFTAAGRTDQENEAYNYVKSLANYRKTSSAITTGKLTQYVPVDWVYTYFRHDNKQTVMVVMNTANEEKNVDLGHFSESIRNFRQGKDVINGVTRDFRQDWKIPGKSIWVMELVK